MYSPTVIKNTNTLFQKSFWPFPVWINWSCESIFSLQPQIHKSFSCCILVRSQNSIQNKIPYLKLTWTILRVKSNITFTSSIWSTNSLTTAVLGSIAINYLINNLKIQKFFWWLDLLKKVYLNSQLHRNHCHICNLHHLCSFHDHCNW